MAHVAGVEPALRFDGTGRAVVRVLPDDTAAPDLHPAYREGLAGHVPPAASSATRDLSAGGQATEPASRGPSSGLAVIMLAASVIP
jgi:hypothetical protein